jgi:DNA-binding protein H-NS
MPRRPALSTMSFEDLVKLRNQVATTLSRHATAIRAQLASLAGHEQGGERSKSTTRKSQAPGRKVPPKYRDKSGNTWSGRGAQPRWMTAAIGAGAKREDFLIDKPATPAKRPKSAPRRKSAKRPKSAGKRLRPSKRRRSRKRARSAKTSRGAKRASSAKRARFAKRPKYAAKRVTSATRLGNAPSIPAPRPSAVSEPARQNEAISQSSDI